MECQIREFPENRVPYHHSWVYKNPFWVPSICTPNARELTGEEIPRSPKVEYRVSLIDTQQGNEPPVARQWHVITYSYWQIVTEYISSLENNIKWTNRIVQKTLIEGTMACLIQHLFPEISDTTVQRYLSMIDEKLEPIVKKVIRDYKKSEEYDWLLINLEMKARYKTRQKSGANRKKSAYEREDCFHRFRKGACAGLKHLQLSADEKILANEIILAGYKRLAMKYHPDQGGNTRMMQRINIVKEKLKTLL